jgi:CDGSH iron-sulfur domain-containing protein 3
MKEAKIAQKAPYAVNVEKGKAYHWCSCGLSDNQPFCTGKHLGTPFTPVEFTPDETKKVFLCGCKRTKTAPFCDGSHMNIK